MVLPKVAGSEKMTNIDELEKLLKQNQELMKQIMEQKNKTQKKSKGSKTKKATTKKVKKEKPKLPYSATPEVLMNMKSDECKSRFGIVYNSDEPYNISGKAIEKFYKDYNIDKRFKVWHLSYSNKDIINDKQLEKQPKEVKVSNIENRIKHIEKKLNGKHKGKSVNQKDKITNFLIGQLEKLEEQLGEL